MLAGLLLGMGYSLMGVRYPALFAVWGAIARLIPWFGVVIATLPLFLVEVGSSPLLGFLATAYTIGVLLFLKMIIEPRYFHRQHYSSLLIVTFVVILAEAFGVIGVMLAPLLSVTIQILFQQLYPLSRRRFSPELSEKILELRNRLAVLCTQIKGARSRQTAFIVNKMNYLVRRATDFVQE
jgi:predicted PurR-regulated permease PerM